jgi:hypothetical protein
MHDTWRHVGLKWVTHRFWYYIAYVFDKTLHMKKIGTLYDNFDIERN